MKIIRDAIHNNIELNALELSILDAPSMQRLRHVRQLALAYLVYPSALHTRFEHSLGTFHLTKTLASRIFEDKREVELLSLCGLLHDIGHSAFSHLPEEILIEKLGKNHEKLGEEKILKSEISDILLKNSISPKEIIQMLKGKKGQIISSDLGTDRIDYLLRDAYFTGVGYSLIDAQRLLFSLGFRSGKMVLEEKGFLAAESLLVSRYLMFNAVYNHHAVRIAGEMLVKALRIALDCGKLDLDELANGTDESIFYSLKDQPLIERLAKRNLFKIAYEDSDFPPGTDGGIYSELNDALTSGLGPDQFAICMPKQSMGKITMPIIYENGKATNLGNTSILSKAVSLERKANGLIVAVDQKNIQKAIGICRKIL